MSQELLYTSAPRGLKPGSRGFCTVASTQGMPPNLAERLEALSGYRHLFPPQDAQAALNPINWSHLRLTISGRHYHVLSRIAAAGLDYTQRSNKIAHHVVLEGNDLIPAGPAAMLAANGFMDADWDGTPRTLPSGRQLPSVVSTAGICRNWMTLTGDAGWGGVLAETALAVNPKPTFIVFPPGTDLLPLFCESLALLAPERRWQVTFSSYFTKLPPGIDCQWRGVVENSPEAAAARRSAGAFVIDLCRPLSRAAGGPLVGAACSGVIPASKPTLPPPLVHSAGDGGFHELERMLGEEATVTCGKGGKRPAAVRMGTAQTVPPPAPSNRSVGPTAIGQFNRKRRSGWPIVFVATIAGLSTALVGSLLYFKDQPREQANESIVVTSRPNAGNYRTASSAQPVGKTTENEQKEPGLPGSGTSGKTTPTADRPKEIITKPDEAVVLDRTPTSTAPTNEGHGNQNVDAPAPDKKPHGPPTIASTPVNDTAAANLPSPEERAAPPTIGRYLVLPVGDCPKKETLFDQREQPDVSGLLEWTPSAKQTTSIILGSEYINPDLKFESKWTDRNGVWELFVRRVNQNSSLGQAKPLLVATIKPAGGKIVFRWNPKIDKPFQNDLDLLQNLIFELRSLGTPGMSAAIRLRGVEDGRRIVVKEAMARPGKPINSSMFISNPASHFSPRAEWHTRVHIRSHDPIAQRLRPHQEKGKWIVPLENSFFKHNFQIELSTGTFLNSISWSGVRLKDIEPKLLARLPKLRDELDHLKHVAIGSQGADSLQRIIGEEEAQLDSRLTAISKAPDSEGKRREELEISDDRAMLSEMRKNIADAISDVGILASGSVEFDFQVCFFIAEHEVLVVSSDGHTPWNDQPVRN